ncbi:MAG: FKBP-type peptidyl-prolyl cis-trans isomerase [Thermodesulfobacterium sp.]|uniref:Trigger factor n=1 Tax=Candidatus Thermodesulfobacterium syntrophicum TaxID=3060442 RepID=A0AAE3TG86_9BACT|nr:FKBP-type peptidyl-prolyl cis-trans isomerase [Candidatus Thermodesulfobacterium syntrophicum]
MKVELQDLNEVEKLLKVEVPREKVNEVIQKITTQVRKKAKIKGFREGKVPVYLVKKLFKEEIEEKSIARIIEDTLNEAIKETKVEPLLRPKVEELGELKEGESFNYSVLVEVRPEINIKREDYIGVEVERDSDELDEEEVDRVLNEFRYSFSGLKKVEKGEPIEERYVAVIKFEAYEGDKLIPGHQAEALFVDVGTGEFNEKVEKELVGKKEGDRFRVEVEYPEEGLNPLLAGKKVRYEIEVKEVYKRELKELNDEFVKSLNMGFETVEDLRESIKKRLSEEKKRKNENKFRERLLGKILEKVDFKVPSRYVELKLYQLLDQVRETLERDGLSFDKLNISMDKLKERLYPIAEKQAKEELLLEKISELENIEISQEEIDKTVEDISKGLKISMEQARGIVYFNILPKKLAEKTLQFLVNNAKPTNKEN